MHQWSVEQGSKEGLGVLVAELRFWSHADLD